MNFAVVEYRSKSGKIWKHTEDKPNYLCDPLTEIDSTSFGCYVSALNGEHIPLTSQILNRNVFIKKVIKRITGSWPQTYSLDYFKKFDVLMIVHQISDGHEITAFTKRLKKLYPNIFIIGVPTQPFGILKEHFQQNPDWFKDFQEFMNTCDIFSTVVKSTKEEWQTMTTAKVEYLPQPYPVNYTSKFFKTRDQKEKILFVAGVTSRDNILMGHTVAKQIQKKLPEYIIHVTDIPDMDLDTTKLEGSNYEKQPFETWRDHLNYLNKVALVINTDFTQTRGRVQVDCAATGTVSIGGDSDGQADFFSELLANRNTTEEQLIEQAIKILTDNAYYTQITTTATERLQKYNYIETKKRIENLVSERQK
jgi:hypothetical protein